MKRVIARLRELNERLKRRTNTYMVCVSVVVGLLAGFGAVGFRLLIQALQRLFWQGHQGWFEGVSWYWVLGAPAVGGFLVAAIVHYFAPEAKGHGVPEVMDAIARKGGRIRPRVVGIKALASGICIASGGSVGREGPIVQIGAAIGSSLGQLLDLGAKRMRILVACGAAAGIAATFNAPIAGVIFATEVFLGDFRIAQISPIVVAAVLATAVTHSILGDEIAFQIPQYAQTLVHPIELAGYALLGILAAFVGVLFIRTLYFTEDLLEKPKIPVPVLGLVGGLAVGTIALLYPQVLGVGYGAIQTVLEDNSVWQLMAVLIAAKLLAVCITLGTGGSGGVFAPSLFLGAMLGGLVGVGMNAVFPGEVGPAGAYAAVGMAAVVAATTHAPLAAFLILFEMTRDYEIILPLMIACVIGTLLSARIQPESIYTMKLIRRGISIRRGRDVNILRDMPVRAVMRTQVPTLPPNARVPEILALLAHENEEAYFVQDAEGRYLGTVTLRELSPVLDEVEATKDLIIASDLMGRADVPVGPDEGLDKVLERLQDGYRDEFAVVEDGRLIGAVHLEDVLSAYRQEVFRQERIQPAD